MNYCSSIAKNLHRRSIEEILVHPYYMEEFRPDLITQYLEELVPNNMIVTVESKGFDDTCDQV